MEKISEISSLKSAARLFFFITALFLLMASCGPDPFFIKVLSIEDVPETGEPGTPLTLTATVRPAFASNKDIVWSVKDTGTAEASISGNILDANAIGTVSIRAIIANGIAEGKDYTQDFIIYIREGGQPVTPITYYNVTFESNGGSNVAGQSVEEGGYASRPANPVRAGYNFIDWYDNEGLIDPPYNFNLPVAYNITLYAKWSYNPVYYTVTFNSNGGNEIQSQTVNEGGKVSKPTEPYKSGYNFGGWYREDALINPWDFNINTVTGNITLYARWTSENNPPKPPPDAAFTSIADMDVWLSGKPDNPPPAAPYYIVLNVNDITGISSALNNKYVNLNLSGSSITQIQDGAFNGCNTLTDITIPESVSGIGIAAFQECYNLKSIFIPNNVESIGLAAFYRCQSLTDVTIGNKVTSIGEQAFTHCVSLTGITIPDSVASIGSSAFTGCSSLTGVTIPNNITGILDYTFSDCSSLAKVTIPNNVKSIGDYAFSGCESLTGVTIGTGVTDIGVQVFQKCTGLIEFKVDSGNLFYSSDQGVLYNKGRTSLIQFPGGKSDVFIIPGGVTSIEDNAFRECTGLKGVTIPNSVTKIGFAAFYGCTDLTSVTFQGTINNSDFDENAFIPSDLKTKFYSGAANGTPGTYTRANGSSDTWTKL